MRFRNRSVLLFAFGLMALSVGAAKASTRPILVSTPTSTRAIALEAMTFDAEPFSPTSSSILYGSDRDTRIIVFVLNLSLQSSETVDVLSADAEDATQHHFQLRVEYFAKVPGQDWLSMAVLKLDSGMGDAGDVLLQLSHHDIKSNRVRVGIGHIGGGPSDDPGSAPTPAPPYLLSGQISVGGLPFSGVTVNLAGASPASAITTSNGTYSFTINVVGDYTLTATQKFYTFIPAPILIANLANSQTVNFAAVRDTHSVTGIVKDEQGTGVGGVSLMLESSSGAGPISTTSASDGSYSFKNVPAGYDYKVTPTDTALFAFTSQNITELKDNAVLTFNATLRQYTISGHMTDNVQGGVSGVTVTLTGAATASVTTDANGNYSFPNLFAGRSYTVSATRTDHFVNPASQTFNLLRDERADFSAIRYYIISGRVTGSGRGLWGIIMTLTGPETTTMRTASDGSYSFTVTTAGSYVLTPSREQDLYQFMPAQPTLNVTDRVTVNFTGEIALTSPTSVLEFDGTPKTVDYNLFWPPDTDVGHFFWEFWAMPGNDDYARYLLSDGYGGAHALLFGFNYGPQGHYNLMGNIWIGSGVVYFLSDDGPAPGEWGHYAVGWDGKSITTYYDGIPVGKVPFAGPRFSLDTGWGATMLLIGGSGHQNFIGRIAQVRGYEENNPHESSPESSFSPETVFSADGQLLSYYFHPSTTVADLSNGYHGVQHNGWPRGMLQYYWYGCDGCPTPQFVIDPTAPNFSNPTNPGTASTLVDAPASAPDGARVFDSFSRNNSTYILNGKGGLGVTELGGKTWQTNMTPSGMQPFGILSGHAVPLADQTGLAWVPVDSATGNLDIRVNRTRGTYQSGTNTGLCFRVVDRNNYYFAFSVDNNANPSGPKQLVVGYVQSGATVILTNSLALTPDAWTTLRVVTKASGEIMVYSDNDLVYSITNSFAASTKNVGLFYCCAGLGLQDRWDNFTVFEAQ